MIILCARLRASKLACPSVSALFLPNTCQSQPRFIQASILDQWTVRARFFHRFDTGEREERDGSPWGSAKSFAPSTSHAYASITNHSREKVNFFLGRRKSVSKDDDDQFYRRHFNRKFGLREPLPRAKIRACLFPNCHRGRVERKGMEEGIDTGEFKSLRREKGIWFGDLNRVEFLAVGQVFFYFFNFLEFINTSKIHFFLWKETLFTRQKSVQETRLIEEATFRCVTYLRPFFYPCHIRVRVYLAPICLFQAKLRVKECRAGKYLHWRAMMRMQWTGNVILSCRSWLRSECD